MHLISLKQWDAHKIQKIIDRAIDIKQHQKDYHNILLRKSLAMLFQKTSTRTRVSFEVAMTQLGGHALYINWKDTNFKLAAIEDEIRYLSSNVDIIMARMLENKSLLSMEGYSSVPIINGCCEKFHPCQVISDFMTIKEEFGNIVDIVYIGMHNNIANSLVIIADKLKTKLTLVTPEMNKPAFDEDVWSIINNNPLTRKEDDLDKAIKSASVIYTDSWVDMEYFEDPSFAQEKKRRIDKMLPYQINKELTKKTNALIMHDMPIHEGYEITRDAIEHKRSIIFKQCENRLHAQKAILIELLS